MTATKKRPSTPEDTLSTLFVQHRVALRLEILRRGFSQSDVDDILQETFLRAARYQSSLHQPERALNWLRTIAQRTCIDFNRSHSHLQSDPSLQPISVSRASDTALLEKERHQEVHHAIASLPTNQRKAVEDFYPKERSYPEIEAHTGLSRAWASQSCWRCRVLDSQNLDRVKLAEAVCVLCDPCYDEASRPRVVFNVDRFGLHMKALPIHTWMFLSLCLIACGEDTEFDSPARKRCNTQQEEWWSVQQGLHQRPLPLTAVETPVAMTVEGDRNALCQYFDVHIAHVPSLRRPLDRRAHV